MYTHTAAGMSSAGGVLAFTGSHNIWFALGAFALIAAGSAVNRLVPRAAKD